MNRTVDVKSDDEGETSDEFEIWTEEAVDIETPFSRTAQSESPRHTEYLRLEVTELKQLLIALAHKYKLSEDRRKVAERRNSFLQADNIRLKQISDSAQNQKLEAEVENRKTLEKLREFMNFREQFEKQAELLQRVINHLPKRRNATTSSTDLLLLAEKSSGEDTSSLPQTTDSVSSPEDALTRSAVVMLDLGVDEERKDSSNVVNLAISNTIRQSGVSWLQEDIREIEKAMKKCQRIEEEEDKEGMGDRVRSRHEVLQELEPPDNDKKDHNSNKKIWEPIGRGKGDTVEVAREERVVRSNVKVSNLKQELLALKNMNRWKTDDLEYKTQQLAVKNRELTHAQKEILKLKMEVSRLLVEQQKR